MDLKSKLIIKSETTSAEVHDSRVFKQLLDGKDEAVFTDSAYYSEKNKLYVLGDINRPDVSAGGTRLRSNGELTHMGADICWGIGLKRAKNHNHLCNLSYNMDRYSLAQNGVKSCQTTEKPNRHFES